MQATAEERREREECQILYVTSAPHEHLEGYLQALWLLENRGNDLIRISSLSQMLKVSPPSVVEMLHRIERERYIKYRTRKGVELLPKGRKIGRKMIRNARLVEVLTRKRFKIPIDPRISSGMEHHLTERFSTALCALLEHPKICPHGNPIPPGSCCRR